ncbi:zinc finger MYND domain-containing protein 15 [Oryza brachyantha]|uniref:zinc finger MYND domain-containing protein 15 n=1 Tax=Oryza brachyantha TaxID=4533 RepID=UPI001ADC60E2|nr:zinc finger MYND domain-containing protein 15 [Oryza brachyantha]XP_040381623.1 zinc finger MYND domain-containing protein 15 [Oryza brachyantha]XP_040381624.1 zinc finger MYND domain-containing protein 15 [Oryza brachyantha]
MECAAKGLVAEPCAGGGAQRRCGGCGAVAYCSRAHQDIHWSVHQEECSRLASHMRRNDLLKQFPFTFSVESPASNHTFSKPRCFFLESLKLHQKGFWKSECICGPEITSVKDLSISAEWDIGSSLCPCTEPETPVPKSLSTWEDYYQWRSLPLHSPAAVLLHWPLTLYHCIQLSRLQTSKYDGQDTLRIHYLGPEKELLQLAVFGELRALYPGVRLYIELVGPAVPKSRDGEVINISSYAHCSDESCCCKSSIGPKDLICSSVTFKLRKGLYHERYSDILKDSKPHLIIAPNAGVAAYPTWKPTIEIINEVGVPAFFTDFCEEAAHLASSCINSITGQPLRVPIQVNPFRQPIAVDNSALCLPCYSNCFVFGM